MYGTVIIFSGKTFCKVVTAASVGITYLFLSEIHRKKQKRKIEQLNSELEELKRKGE